MVVNNFFVVFFGLCRFSCFWVVFVLVVLVPVWGFSGRERGAC